MGIGACADDKEKDEEEGLEVEESRLSEVSLQLSPRLCLLTIFLFC